MEITEETKVTIIFDMIETVKDFVAEKIESELDSDLIFFHAPINHLSVRTFKEILRETYLNGRKNKNLTIILNTSGGNPTRIPDMVAFMRGNNLYNHIRFIIFGEAISAGTLLSFSGNEIYMDYTSNLGPLDLQIKQFDNSWQIIKKNIDAILPNVPKEMVEKLKDEIGYDANNEMQTHIRDTATLYLSKYHKWSDISDDGMKKLMELPNILTDKKLMEKNGITGHDFPIILNHAVELGLRIINYQEKESLFNNVRKLYNHIVAEQLMKQALNAQASQYFLYSRHYRGYLCLGSNAFPTTTLPVMLEPK